MERLVIEVEEMLFSERMLLPKRMSLIVTLMPFLGILKICCKVG
ncbi:hypothetical protein ES705_41486 [subsurface metagenome]